MALLAFAVHAACAAGPSTSTSTSPSHPARGEAPVPHALQRFADACRFVPPDLLSFAFVEEPIETVVATTTRGEPGRTVLVVRAGRDFDAPKDIGVGPFTGVEIVDFGSGGVVRDDDEPAPSTTIEGVPVSYRAERTDRVSVPPRWTATVDGRFRITSSTRETLALALRRTGRIDDVLRPFPAVHELPDAAAHVVCTLPDPADLTQPESPMPKEAVVSAILRTPLRLSLWTRQPLPRYASAFAWTHEERDVATTRRGHWVVTDVPVEEGADSLVAMWRFGLQIWL